MHCYGTFRRGFIELDPGCQIPEGTLVRIIPVPSRDADPFDTLGDDAIDTGIPDLAEQHVHHASDATKRQL
jgi:hypothetical protein